MASAAAIAMTYASLGFDPSSVPSGIADLVAMKIDAAAAELADAGIVIDEGTPHDMDLLTMYASWLYEGRKNQTEKPLMLQKLLRNRQAAQAVEAAP